MQPLTQYFSQESIEAGMIPYEQYHPYPQAAERGFWEKTQRAGSGVLYLPGREISFFSMEERGRHQFFGFLPDR